MPTSIFNCLKDEKRDFITNVLINEYTNKPFEKVTVSTIVKAANIARGSFYQYFEDLEDAYTYTITFIMKNAIKKNIDILNIKDIEKFFQQVKVNFEKKAYEVVYGEKNTTEYMLMRQIKNSKKGLQLFSKNVDLVIISNDIIKKHIDDEFIVILNLTRIIIRDSVCNLFILNDYEKSINDFNLKINILKEGSKIVLKK